MAAEHEGILETVWKELQDHYPMMEYMGAHGDAWLEEFRPRVLASETQTQAYEVIHELVCRLNDYHTQLTWPGEHLEYSSPPFRADIVSDGRRQAVAVVSSSPELPLEPGDEIQAVDGQPVRVALADARLHSYGSTPAARDGTACQRMFRGPREKPLAVTIRRAGDTKPREISLSRSVAWPREPFVIFREAEEVPVIAISEWTNRNNQKVVEAFDALLEEHRRSPFLVIDVRGNGGGSDAMADEVTGRFLKETIISSISFHRLVPSLDYRRTVEWAHPRGPWRYEGRFAVLTDEGCKSACEHFVSGMLEAGAYLAGTPTDGACGWIRRVPLPGGAALFVSQTFPLHGKDPSPLHGIRPHKLAPVRLKDLRSGKDAALDAAIRWLRSGMPVPPHQQRLSRQ